MLVSPPNHERIPKPLANLTKTLLYANLLDIRPCLIPSWGIGKTMGAREATKLRLDDSEAADACPDIAGSS